MDSLTIIALTVIGFSIILLMFFWSGLIRKHEGFHPVQEKELNFKVPVPENLPDNVRKHYNAIFEGNEAHQIHTALVWGKARYKISGIWMPLRFQTYYETGKKFARQLDFFWHNKIIMKGVDYYIDGTGLLNVNGIVRMKESGEMIDESQWISLWAESLLVAAVDFNDPRLHWERVDESTTDLIVYRHDHTEKQAHRIRIRFHPGTGRIHSISADRYRGQLGKKRIPWRIQIKKWRRVHSMWLPEYTVTWEDQKKPWCHYVIEGISVDVSGDVLDRINPIGNKAGKKSKAKRVEKFKSAK